MNGPRILGEIEQLQTEMIHSFNILRKEERKGGRWGGAGGREKNINLQVDSTCSSWQLGWWGWGHLTSIYLLNKVGGKGFLPSFVIKQAKPG